VKLSVVIPALEEASDIEAAVASAAGERVEVLVVDGGSRDATPERARKAGATLHRSPPGRARQLGVGASVARGDVVLFLHADTRLPRGWDSAVREALRDPRVVGGCFRLHFEEGGRGAGGLLLRVVEWGTRLRVALFALPYGDQALFVRRSVLERLGGVPQQPIMEDLDLVRAMKRRGRIARLSLPATTSARRYREAGVLRTAARNLAALAGWRLGVDRGRIAAWYRR
jgi:rSAM/selenodomain-associated transferase 2